jgi:SAM-dependent methyltransferase
MAEITFGLRSILSLPRVYDLLQHIFGARSGRRMLVDRFIRPQPGDRVLDIGCGPAKVLALMPDVRYVGYDPNPRYIQHARTSFGTRGSFVLGRFTAQDAAKYEPFDIGLLIGVLHHLDDSEATDLVGHLRAAIRPGGRLVTLDNVFIENQNPFARKIIEWDRGKNVRHASEYRALAAPHFTAIQTTLWHRRFPPYTLFVMECS